MGESLVYWAALSLAIGGIAAYEAYHTYEAIGLASALLILFAVSWLLFRVTGLQRIWSTLGYLKNPAIAGMVFFLLGFYYITRQGWNFPQASLYATGVGVLGAALGMFFYKYWNIGS